MTAQTIIQIINIVVAAIAGVSTALAAIWGTSAKKKQQQMNVLNGQLDSAYQQVRVSTQAATELAQKLPPAPPGGHGFTDQTQSFLLGLPKPLTALTNNAR